jgi:hypothetical protein
MSRQSLSRANQLFYGRASLGNANQDKPGGEVHLLYRFRPVCGNTAALGGRAITFTGALAAGAVSGTLNGNWGGATGIWPITFSDGEMLNGIFTNGSTAVSFLPGSFPQVIQGLSGPYGGIGALVNAVTASATVGGQPPVLGTATAVAASQGVTSGVNGLVNGTSLVGAVAVADVPRNVVAAWTGTAILTIVGTDFYGQPQTEASPSGVVHTGKKAFATITSFSFNATVTAATVGFGNALGLPFAVRSGDIFATAFADGPDDITTNFAVADGTSPATTTTGDVRGTLTPAGTLNGAKFYSALIKPIDMSVQAWAYGVPPV